jgi:apolipoprotein N-acyltransferase
LKWTLPFLWAVLFWASFHPLNWGFLGWISLVPLLLYARWTSGKKSFFVAWAGGALGYGMCFFWVRFTAPPGPYGLGLYKGLYVALFVLFIRRLGPLWSPVIWVGLEYIRGYLFSGLPWFLLGYTQHELFRPIQIADLGGVWLVSALVAFVNGAIVDPRACVKRWAAVALVVSWSYGAIRLGTIEMREGPKVALVQPNIPQDLKAISRESEQQAVDNYEKHLGLTLEVAKEKPDLLVWPEAAVYFGLIWHAEKKEWLKDAWYSRCVRPSEETGIRSLIGLLIVDRLDHRSQFTNSAVYISEEGKILDRFDKVHLVPFAEYIPFTSVFPWIRDLVLKFTGLRLSDMRPGEGFPVWELKGDRFSPQICFEAIFPEISREIARKGATFTVNISNDGWFRDSGELDQMLAMARFRAIENRMHVVRGTNTGISAFIEPTGAIQAMIPGKEVAGTLVARVRVTDSTSVFRTVGNGVAWLAVLGIAASVLRFIFVDRKKRAA